MQLLLVLTHELQDSNEIGDQGAVSIGEGLKVNSSLQELHLVRLVIFICVLHCCVAAEGEGGGECAAVSRDVYAHACV